MKDVEVDVVDVVVEGCMVGIEDGGLACTQAREDVDADGRDGDGDGDADAVGRESVEAGGALVEEPQARISTAIAPARHEDMPTLMLDGCVHVRVYVHVHADVPDW